MAVVSSLQTVSGLRVHLSGGFAAPRWQDLEPIRARHLAPGSTLCRKSRVLRGCTDQGSGLRGSTRGRRTLVRAEGATAGSSGLATLAPAGSDDIEEVDVVVVGGGLAGLAAARELHRASVPFLLLEASDGVGGRVRTDNDHGFLLDRGFQIFLSAYPEAKKVLDYDALDLKPFYAGALVWFDGKFHRVADPFRHPVDGISSIPNPIGTPLDKALVGFLRLKSLTKSVDEILSAPETSIEDRLEDEGFTLKMVNRFFRPFLGGIFFDRELGTTSRLLEFVLRMLALGANTLPAGGIGAIPEQIAKSLPSDSIRLNSRVVEIVPRGAQGAKALVKLANGKTVKAKFGTIVAVEGPEGKKLLFEALENSPSKEGQPRSTVCLYFSSKGKAPIEEPILLLNGTQNGIINNMCFPSLVSPSYAPPGETLISVSLIGQHLDKEDEELEEEVREEVREWFGEGEVEKWKLLKIYRIKYAQPNQCPPTNLKREVKVGEGIFVCGDHREGATFDGALVSGRRAAAALLEEAQKVGVQ